MIRLTRFLRRSEYLLGLIPPRWFPWIALVLALCLLGLWVGSF